MSNCNCETVYALDMLALLTDLVLTYKTKLKLDREVGGVDFSELCTVTYLITYPYG